MKQMDSFGSKNKRDASGFKGYHSVSVGGNMQHPEEGLLISFYNEDQQGNETNSMGVSIRLETAVQLHTMLSDYLSKFGVNVQTGEKQMDSFERNNQCSTENGEHPVWSILRKEAYVDEFVSKAENMYDFIKALVVACGRVTVNGNTVPGMQVFFDMWNEYSSETFRILDSLVNSDRMSDD